jgi:hypothetical protein
MWLEDLKIQGKSPFKITYDPKQCCLMLYFGAYALKEGKERF